MSASLPVVRQYAVTHGPNNRAPVVLAEEPERFDQIRAAVLEYWRPETAIDRLLCDRLIDCDWRLRRIRRIETSVLLDKCSAQRASGPADGRTL